MQNVLVEGFCVKNAVLELFGMAHTYAEFKENWQNNHFKLIDNKR